MSDTSTEANSARLWIYVENYRRYTSMQRELSNPAKLIGALVLYPWNCLHGEHLASRMRPRGYPHVIKQMCERHGEPRTPTIVKRWSNHSDRRDPVASDEYIEDDYKTNVSGVRVKDDLVLNDWRVKNGTDLYHKSYGYLRTPEFSKVLAEFV